MQTSTFGRLGEIKAKQYLISIGYKIIETNYKNKIGEIDIIAKDQDTLVFVEVKTRMSNEFGNPLEAVNIYKQDKIRKVATVYLMKHKLLNVSCRFDVIGIRGDHDEEITHIKNAF